MEEWSDQGIVLSVRGHGENGAVLSVLTNAHGRHNGYVHGAKSSRLRGLLEPGTLLDLTWKSRVVDQLGTITFEHGSNQAASLLGDSLRLAALLSACALCDRALPEREVHPGLFRGMSALIQGLQSDVWAEAYIMWELALLKELGFGLDLTRCVANGNNDDLTHVSPKSGCAVSREMAEPYKEKLLRLPVFLSGRGSDRDEQADIVDGLRLTGYFLEHWVFAHHSHGIPDARARLQNLYENSLTR